MRSKGGFLYKKARMIGISSVLCLVFAILIFGGIKMFAEMLDDDVRVNEDEDLTYYITVNSDGIDYEGTESSNAQVSKEVSGVTKVTDVVPDGLTFVDFIKSSDGTFGSVRRDDKTTACAGILIDDTNEDGVDAGVWNDETNEYTYHGLHYDANTRTVTFRTKGITAGCELTVGVVTHTPVLPEGQARADFYNTARFVDETITDKSNTVHAYILKSFIDGNYTVTYRYDGVVPEDAPHLPSTTYLTSANGEYTLADAPSLEGYRFTGWLWDPPTGSTTGLSATVLGGRLPGYSVEFYGQFVPETISDDTPEPEGDVYPLRYRYDGNVPVGAPRLPATQWYAPRSDFTMAPKPEVECYSFDGWKWTPAGAPASLIYTDPYSTLNGKTTGTEMVFFGSFTWTCEGDEPEIPDPVPELYNVSYEIDGTKPDDFDIPASRSYLESASVEMDSTKEGEVFDGYEFSGWDSDDIEIGNSLLFAMPSHNVVLRGSFEQNEYTVSYAYSGDVIPEGAESLLPETRAYRAGETVELAGAVSAEGYTFMGWMAEPSFEMPEKDVVIYGEWTKNKETFAPELSIRIKNPKDEYYIHETVEFEITVKNNQNFDFNDVWLEELLEGTQFVPGDGYTVERKTFANIAKIRAGEEAVIDAEFEVTKNSAKEYANIVELIALESSDENYSLPNEWDNKVSADFVTGIVSGLPVDDKEPGTPVTLDSVGKVVGSAAILSGGLFACIVLFKKTRRGGIIYGYMVGIMSISGLAVVLLNGGHLFADSLHETPELDIYSSNSTYNSDPGSWDLHESASWVGEGEALLKLRVDTKKISDLHNKDVILVLDNSNWSAKAIDGTDPDNEYDLPLIEIMKNGASDFVEDLLKDGDSRVLIMSTWGSEIGNFTSNSSEAIAQISSIEATLNTNFSSYSNTFSKLISYLGSYEQSEDRMLNIVYVSDDHFAENGDIVKYRMVKSMVPNSVISGIDVGVKELVNERYISGTSAMANGVVRYWVGIDGNLSPIGAYDHAVDGLDKISECHKNPYQDNYVSALVQCVDSSLKYGKFNISTKIDTSTFSIKGIYGNTGDIDVEDDVISWINEDDSSFVSGGVYEMSVLLKAKDNTVEKHKLYQLNSETTVESDATEVPAENVSLNGGIVLKNGYELAFDINNSGVCELGDNEGGIYWAFQRFDLDESGIKCDGWNFDTFKDPDDGTIYNSKTNRMPTKDIAIRATWRKTDVEIHMDGNIYSAAPAVLKTGIEFNKSLDAISNSNILLKGDTCPKSIMDDAHRVSDDSSASAVYIWSTSGYGYEYADPNTGEGTYYYNQPSYYCTDASKIVLNEDSSRMFSEGGFTNDEGEHDHLYSYIKMLDEDVGNWDASNVKDMNHMFMGTRLGVEALNRISNWDTSSVENMDYMFENDTFEHGSTENEKTVLGGWDTSSVESMEGAFKCNYSSCNNIVDIAKGLKNWDTSNVKNMKETFKTSGIASFDNVSTWNTSSVETMEGAFESVFADFSGLSGWNVGNVKNMKKTFSGAKGDWSALASWNVSNVEDFSYAFESISSRTSTGGTVSIEGLRNWTPASAKSLNSMFYNSKIEDISPLSSWTVSSVEDMSYTFAYSKVSSLTPLSGWDTSNIEALKGTFKWLYDLSSLSGLEEWDVKKVKTISELFMDDTGLVDIDGLSDWEVIGLEDMSRAFEGISASNLTALADWDVSKVKDMSYAFCGAPQEIAIDGGTNTTIAYCPSGFSMMTKTNGTSAGRGAYGGVASLEGVEEWNTESLEKIDALIAGSIVTDLTPIAGWNVKNLTHMQNTFMFTEIESLAPLSDWETDSLKEMEGAFACMPKLKNLEGLNGWDVSNVRSMYGTFGYMDSLESVSALRNWQTDSLDIMAYILVDHKKLTSLDGMEGWNVSNVTSMQGSFMGYSQYSYDYYTEWSSWCDSKLSDISALASWNVSNVANFRDVFACDNELTSLSALSEWRPQSGYYFSRMFEGDRKVTSLNGLQNWFCDENGCNYYTDHSVEMLYMFMNMVELQDVSAIGNWRDSEDSRITTIGSMFRNDRSITSLAPLEDSVLKRASYNGNTFDGIPSSVARPSWY